MKRKIIRFPVNIAYCFTCGRFEQKHGGAHRACESSIWHTPCKETCVKHGLITSVCKQGREFAAILLLLCAQQWRLRHHLYCIAGECLREPLVKARRIDRAIASLRQFGA